MDHRELNSSEVPPIVFSWESDSEPGNDILTLLILTCVIFSGIAIAVSVRLIIRHLRHFSQPIIQRKIIAILWMVPIYAATSCLSLRFIGHSMFLDMLRDCYEGFVIYMFFALCYCYIGQFDREHIELSRIYSVLIARESISHLIKFPSCFGINPTIDLRSNPRLFLLQCKKYILQFVVIKPLGTTVAMILASWFDGFENGNFSFNNGYIYVTVLTNLSISVSLYWLILFYQATKDALSPFDPVPKFLCIKGVLFFSYWQSVCISLLVKFGIITDLPIIHYTVQHVSSTVQNSLICLEMVAFAIMHSYAFPVDPFIFLPTRLNSSAETNPQVISSARSMLRNAIDLGDMLEDMQEVAPALPIPRFLRRHSSVAVESHEPTTADSEEAIVPIPTKEGIGSIIDANNHN